MIPGVEQGEDSEAETFSGRDLDEGFGGGGEEGFEGMPPSLPHKEEPERSGHGEDEMEVTEGKEMLLLRLRPQSLIETAASRTVSVPAGVVREMSPAAPATIGDMSAEATGAAGGDVSRSLALLVSKTQGADVIAQHVGYGDRGRLAAGHDQRAGGLGFR